MILLYMIYASFYYNVVNEKLSDEAKRYQRWRPPCYVFSQVPTFLTMFLSIQVRMPLQKKIKSVPCPPRTSLAM